MRSAAANNAQDKTDTLSVLVTYLANSKHDKNPYWLLSFCFQKKISERHNSAAEGPASKVEKATGNESNTTGHLLKESLRNSEGGPKNILLGPWWTGIILNHLCSRWSVQDISREEVLSDILKT